MRLYRVYKVCGASREGFGAFTIGGRGTHGLGFEECRPWYVASVDG